MSLTSATVSCKLRIFFLHVRHIMFSRYCYPRPRRVGSLALIILSSLTAPSLSFFRITYRASVTSPVIRDLVIVPHISFELARIGEHVTRFHIYRLLTNFQTPPVGSCFQETVIVVFRWLAASFISCGCWLFLLRVWALSSHSRCILILVIVL